MKKLVCFILVILLIMSVFVGCNKNNNNPNDNQQNNNQNEKNDGQNKDEKDNSEPEVTSNVNPSGLPIVNEPITLKFVGTKQSTNMVPMSEMTVYKQIEKDTNITIEWEEIPDNIWDEKTKLMLSSNKLPDAFCGQKMDEMVINTSGEGGVLISLNELIDSEYSHNIKDLFEKNPDMRRYITFSDGNIYALPTINAPIANMTINGRILLNQVWLDNLGLEKPTTTQEFYEVLEAFEEGDANGNGDPDDEIPFSTVHLEDMNTISSIGSLTSLGGAFNVPYDTKEHIYIKDKTVHFGPVEDGYRDLVEYLHMLYINDLLDEETFSQNASQLKAKVTTTGVGGFLSNVSFHYTEGDGWKDYVAIEPLKGPDGYQEWPRKSDMTVIQKNRFAITSSNENKEATFRWIDYLMDDDEMSISIRFGEKDKAWAVDENGMWDKIAADENGAPLDGVKLSEYCPQYAGVWVLKEKYVTRNWSDTIKSMVDSRELYLDYVIDESWPNLTFSSEDLKELNQIKLDLYSYVNSEFAKFILNGVDDDKWTKYQDKLKALKYERYLEIMQNEYSKFLNN